MSISANSRCWSFNTNPNVRVPVNWTIGWVSVSVSMCMCMCMCVCVYVCVCAKCLYVQQHRHKDIASLSIAGPNSHSSSSVGNAKQNKTRIAVRSSEWSETLFVVASNRCEFSSISIWRCQIGSSVKIGLEELIRFRLMDYVFLTITYLQCLG